MVTAIRSVSNHPSLHRVDSACELDQGTIAGELDYPTAVLGDPGLDQCLAHSLEPGVRAGPPSPISRCIQHVGGEDRGELAFEFLPGHGTAF
jgi:hypothetical protein